MSTTDTTYTCPSSNLKFRKTCSIVECPSNLHKSKGELAHPSGCIHLFLSKPTLEAADLALAFKMTTSSINTKVNEGAINVRRAMLMVKILEDLRINDFKQHCPQCGVLKDTPGKCIKVQACRERKEFFSHLLKRTPYALPYINVELRDFYLLMLSKGMINNRLKKMINEERLSFSQFLNVTPDELNTYDSHVRSAMGLANTDKVSIARMARDHFTKRK